MHRATPTFVQSMNRILYCAESLRELKVTHNSKDITILLDLKVRNVIHSEGRGMLEKEIDHADVKSICTGSTE